MLSADPATWRKIAADIRGGMDAFRAGRLQIRGSLHVGVGFLAATNGSEERGRLEFGMVRTRGFGSISVLSAGTGPETIVCLHGLGGTKASFLPTVVGAGRQLPRRRDRPPGIRRVGQADRRALRRALVRPLGLRRDGRTRHRAGAHRRQQHGRASGDRGRARGSRPHGRAAAAEPGAGLAAPAPVGAHPAGPAARARADPAGTAAGGRGDGAPARAGGERRLDRGGRGRVPARLSEPAAGGRRSTPRRATSTWTSPTARTGSGLASRRFNATRCSSGAARTRSSRSAS